MTATEVLMGAVKFYGISEIADELDERRQTVAQWYRRGKLPEPTEVLAMGPVWTGKAIAPFLREQRRLKKGKP
jgi:hypothetical protein